MFVCFVSSSGNHPEDCGHPQGEMRGLFRAAPQPRAVRRGALAPPGHGRVPREGELRAEQASGRVEVSPSTAPPVINTVQSAL